MRRRKPKVCTNTLALPIALTDDQVLSIIEGEVLGTRLIEELLAMVDRGDADGRAHRIAERDRLQQEISNLMDLVAAGTPASTVAPKIQERQTALDRVERQLRAQRQLPPDIGRLREALEQRAENWKAELRAETQVARLVLRRLIGPITLWDDAGREDFCRWEATTKTELLDGLAGGPVLLMASLMPASWNQIASWLPLLGRLEDSTPFPSALDGAFRTGRIPLTPLTPSLTPRRLRSRR